MQDNLLANAERLKKYHKTICQQNVERTEEDCQKKMLKKNSTKKKKEQNKTTQRSNHK